MYENCEDNNIYVEFLKKYEDDNLTIPEIDDYDLLHFGLYFMKIFEREEQKTNPDFKVLNF